MMTMSEDGERTCPLCAEEMDLTDQQLKPCRCGYEICVWCWHHIIDLAEKEETVGRCPACRLQYDKEKIVAMAANCERVVADMNADKKHKGPKVKPKTSVEAKKHLTSVRVIQRNLVYIIGLPSHLCEESILERKEYFGQYGKVLKVSISRPASSQQTSSNSAFSVYITYAREEDAVRCIQSVHNYVLEGKPLRACFGTTKYCHAWLRNMTCSNPDCLYLHDVGSQEDSFTKDEIISAYSRTRVPQIASNNLQRRTGSVLPPPLDDFSIAGAGLGKSQAKISSNQSAPAPIQVRGSPPDKSVGKSIILPTSSSWGLRASNCRPSAPCSLTLPIKSKAETNNNNNSSLPSSSVEDRKQPSAWNDEEVTTQKIPESRSNCKKPSSWPNEMIVLPKESENNDISSNKSIWHDKVVTASKAPESRSATMNKSSLHASLTESSKLSSVWHDNEEAATSKAVESKETLHGLTNQVESFKLGSWEDYELPLKEALENDFGPGSSALNADMVDQSNQGDLSSAPDDKENHKFIQVNKVAPMNNHLQKSIDRTSKATPELSKNCNTSNGVPLTMSFGFSSMPCSKDLASASELSDTASVMQEHGYMGIQLPKQELFSSITAKDDPVLPFDNKIPRPADSAVHKLPTHSSYSLWSNNLGTKQPSHIGVNSDNKLEPLLLHPDREILPFNAPKADGLSSPVDRKDVEYVDKSCTQEKFVAEGRGGSIVRESSELDVMGESNIISDILSLDFDPWDDLLFSSNDLVKLLGEDSQQDGSSMLSTPWKPQSSNQSRFSFAWQENQGNLVNPLADDMGHMDKFYSSSSAHEEGFQSGPMFNHFEGHKTATANSLFNHPDSTSGTLRSRISAPPGFSAPSKAMPPGFSSQDRFNQVYETTYTEGSMFGGPLVGSGFQSSHVSGISGDLELSDPAIMMAVGKDQMALNLNNPGLGLTPSFAKCSTSNDRDPRLHLLMQQPVSSHQNLRLPEQMGERYLSVNDLFITSQLLAQNHSTLSPFDPMSLHQPISSHFSSQRDGWNGFHSGGDVHLGERLKNDRYGLTNYYSSNDESKFHMPSGNLYNRAFGM